MPEAYEKIWETCNHVVNSNIAIGSLPTLQTSHGLLALFLLWRADLFRLLKYRGGCTIPLFKFSVWCEKCVAALHYAVICKQLLNATDINRFRQVVLDLLQDGACTDLFENLSENSLKGDLSNATTFNPPLFSLVDTFKIPYYVKWSNIQIEERYIHINLNRRQYCLLLFRGGGGGRGATL